MHAAVHQQDHDGLRPGRLRRRVAGVQLSATVPAPPFLLFNSSDEIIPLAQGTGMAQALSSQCTATKGTTSTELVAVPGDQHASTYTDIVSGPELDFANAVTGGTLPGGCTIASPLTGASVAYDAAAGAKSLIGFGGCCTASGTVAGTTEVYKASTGTWKPVTITGTAPPARLGATFGWDPASGDLVLFGGEYLPGGTAQPEALNDTWELSYTASANTGTWTQVDTGTGCPTACPGAPAARYAAAADEAPRDQGLVLFGGESVVPADQAGAPVTYGDTWLWNGTSKTWTALNPTGASGVDPRYGQVLAYYGPKNLDLMFGGNQGASTSFCNKNGSCLDPLNDTWELTYNATAGTWAWTSAGTAPSGLLARVFAAGASSADRGDDLRRAERQRQHRRRGQRAASGRHLDLEQHVGLVAAVQPVQPGPAGGRRPGHGLPARRLRGLPVRRLHRHGPAGRPGVDLDLDGHRLADLTPAASAGFPRSASCSRRPTRPRCSSWTTTRMGSRSSAGSPLPPRGQVAVRLGEDQALEGATRQPRPAGGPDISWP